MKDLEKYLEEIVCLCHYPITISADTLNDTKGLLVKKVDAVEEVFSAEPLFELDKRICLEFEEQDDYAWRFQRNKSSEITLESFFENSDGILYGLYGMYSMKEEMIYFNVRASLPVTIWINGQLVAKSTYSYHIKPYQFICQLKKGINTVLIERQAVDCNKEMEEGEKKTTILYAKLAYLEQMKVDRIFDPGMKVQQMKKRYDIALKKMFPENGANELIIIPQYPVDSQNCIMELTNVEGNVISQTKIPVREVVKIHFPDQDSICKLKFTKAEEMEFYLPACKKEELLRCIDGDEEEDFVSFAKKTLEANTMLNWGKRELTYQRTYQFVLKKIFEKLSTVKPYRQNLLIGKVSQIDGGKRYYTLFFPKDCEDIKSLVVFLPFGTIGEMIPEVLEYVYQGRFSDCMIMGLYKKGSNNKDYIDEMSFLEDLQEVVTKYQIDRNRIYTVGICTGALISFGLAIRYPDLFAGVGIINGTIRLSLDNPDYGLLSNLSNTKMIHLNSINDNFFNTARIVNTNTYFQKMETHLFQIFNHKDGIEELDNALFLDTLLENRREEFPKHVKLKVNEPYYNKSFWLLAGDKIVMDQQASVCGDMDEHKVRICADNLRYIDIFLARKEMGLSDEIQIECNNQIKKVCLKEYNRIRIQMQDDLVKIETVTEDEFKKVYNRIALSEDKLGIQDIYLRRCNIIFANYNKQTLPKEWKKIARKLMHPLVERARTYRYSIVGEEQIREEANIIFVDQAEQGTDYSRQLRERYDLICTPEILQVEGTEYKAPYFLLMKKKNPYQEDYNLLYIVQSGAAEDLLDTLKEFNIKEIFTKNRIIYSEGILQME